jgi:hypothetical protein
VLYEGILPVFRDEEMVVINLVKAYYLSKGKTVYTGIETPDTGLETKLPFIRIGRVGGAPARGAEHTDRPVVDVDVFSSKRSEAKLMSNEILQLLISAPHPIDNCNVLIGPQKLPWVEGIPIVRLFASYHLDLRRASA